MSAEHNPGLYRFARLTAGATFLLLIAGALVTSNDAGLAVPDWPLSYGTWMPPMVGNIVYEHGHRLVATFVGLLTTILALWLWRKEPRRWVRRLGFVALGAIILQGVLGGITVLFLLPRPVSIAHATLAQLFFCLSVSLALFTSPGWKKEEPRAADPGAPPLSRLGVAMTLVILVQLVLGAAFRHSAVGLAPHLVGAALVTALVAWTARRVWAQHSQQPTLHRLAWGLVGLLVVQLPLGAGAYWARLAAADSPQPTPALVALTAAHVAVGALLLAISVVLTLQTHRRLAPPEEVVRLTASPEKAAV